MATAEQVDFLVSDYRHPTTGEPLANGKVYTYIAGTSTAVNLYTDGDKGGNATNPIILSAIGTANVYGDGFYKFRLYDSDDNFVEELTGLYYKVALVTSAIFETEHNSNGTHSTVTISDSLALGTNKITGVGTPTLDYDAATKKYVDDNIVNITPTPVANDFAKWTNATTLEGRSYSETLSDLSGEATATFDFNTQKISGVVDPTTDQQVATKKYVDDNIGSGKWITTSGTEDGFRVTSSSTGTASAVLQNEVLASNDHALFVYSDAIQINSALAKFEQDNASSTASTLILQQDGTGHGQAINLNGDLASSRYGLRVLSSVAQTNSELLYVHSDHASSTANVTSITNDGTGNGLYIYQVGVTPVGKHALYVYSDSVQTDAFLAKVEQNNVGSTASCLRLINEGTGHGLRVDTNKLLASGKYGLHLLTDVAQTTSAQALIHSTHASTDKPALQVSYAGNDKAVAIYNSNANGYAIFSQNADTTGYNAIFYNDGGVVGAKGIAVQTGTDDGTGFVYFFDANDGDGTLTGYLGADNGVFGLYDASCESLKKDIEDSELDFENIILGTKVRKYKWKKNGELVEGGLIAQEVERVFPQAVPLRPGTEKYIKKRARGDVIIPDSEESESYKLWARDIDERDFRRKKMPGKFRVMEPEIEGVRKRKKGVSHGRYITPLIMMAQKQATEIKELKSDIKDLMKRLDKLEAK